MELEQPAATEMLLECRHKGHPSTQNPPVVPILSKVISTVPALAHETLAGPPYHSNLCPAIFMLIYFAPDTMNSLLLPAHARTHLEASLDPILKFFYLLFPLPGRLSELQKSSLTFPSVSPPHTHNGKRV